MDYSTIQTTESKEVVKALEQLIEPLLVPGEAVIVGVPATWRDKADLVGPGNISGSDYWHHTFRHLSVQGGTAKEI